MYGDVRTDDLLLIEKGNFLFLVQRSGEAIQISRRKGKHRFLLNAIRAELEATRQPNGYYLVNGEEYYRVSDTHVYERFVQEINQERKAAIAEQEAQKEPRPADAPSQSDGEESPETIAQQEEPPA
jgi:hypothetical protein